MKKEVKLILGGGSAFGLAHIGAIAAIAEEYQIRSIVGTSMGAIIGGLCACGHEPLKILELVEDYKTHELFNPLHLDISRSGIFDGRSLLKRFEQWTSGCLIEELEIALIAVAYDLASRQTVLIDKGSLASAMRASSSLPYIFAPHVWGRYLFVDGGVEHPLPVAFAERMEGEMSIAVNVLPPVSLKAETIDAEPIESNPKMRSHQVFMQTLMQNQAYVSIQALLSHPPDLIIDAHQPRYSFFSMDKAREFYDHGFRRAQKAISDFGEPSFRDQLLKKYQALMTRFGG